MFWWFSNALQVFDGPVALKIGALSVNKQDLNRNQSPTAMFFLTSSIASCILERRELRIRLTFLPLLTQDTSLW